MNLTVNASQWSTNMDPTCGVVICGHLRMLEPVTAVLIATVVVGIALRVSGGP